MKRIFILLFICLVTNSQVQIKTFTSYAADVYEEPSTDARIIDRLRPFSDIIVTGIADEFYKVENSGFVERDLVSQNDQLYQLNLTLVDEKYKTMDDSLAAKVEFLAPIFLEPNSESRSGEVLQPGTEVIVTARENNFYKLYGLGYVQGFKLHQSGELKLLKKGLGKEQREEYADSLKAYSKALDKEYKNILIKKYGSKTAERLLNNEIWLGMTTDMARTSLGSPLEKTETISKYGTQRLWHYKQVILLFVDGVLESVQYTTIGY